MDSFIWFPSLFLHSSLHLLFSLPFYLNFLVAPLIDRSAFFACFETDDSSGYSAVSQHSKNIQFHSFGSAGLHLHFSLVDCCRYHSLGKLLSFPLFSIVYFNRHTYIVLAFSSILPMTAILPFISCILLHQFFFSPLRTIFHWRLLICFNHIDYFDRLPYIVYRYSWTW